MRKTKSARASASLRPRLRVKCGEETALGPGRVDLLELIAETGSLTTAARRMGMSYMRAWTLVKSLNGWFGMPLVTATRGGKSGGGATLTETGRAVVVLYRRMEERSRAAAGASWKELRKLLKR